MKHITRDENRIIPLGRILEFQAREIAAARSRTVRGTDPVDIIDRQIIEVLNHMDEAREHHRQIRHSLLINETYINTERMQMEARTHRYSPQRWPEREKFHRRLENIEAQRRHHSSTELGRMHVYQSRLRELFERRRQLED